MEEKITSKLSEPMISKYMHQKGNALGIPVSGSFELTPRCNFNCKMCYVHMTNEQIKKSGKRELTADEWLTVASDAVDAGMLFLLLTGGEPFLRPDFETIYKEAKKMGLMLSINSNGSLLDKYWIDFLHNNPPARMNITLYGGSDQVYEQMCGKPMFHQVVENVRALKAAGISVRLNASITPDNKQNIEEIYRLAKELDVHVKATAYMFPSIRLGENIPGNSGGRFRAEEAAAYMLKCQEQYMTKEQLESMARMPLSKHLTCEEENREGIRCRAGRSTFWMTWDGEMMPCGMMNEQGQSVLEKGFRKCWEETRRKAEEIKLPRACSGCEYKEGCNVCAASCYAETGGYEEKPEYICRFVKEMRRLTQEKYLNITSKNDSKSI